jgi:uncharacterized protein
MPQLLFHPSIAIAALLTLAPYFAAGFWPSVTNRIHRLPPGPRILLPGLLAVPYALVSLSLGIFRWKWLALYALLPLGISALLFQARQADPEQRGTWRDYLILLIIGLAVDLRWFDPAWGPGLAAFNKIVLLDAGIWAFLGIRQISGVGFDLRLKLRDLKIGGLALAAYTPIAISLGLVLGFLHYHPVIPTPGHVLLTWLFTFFFIAVPEELFFRGWIQNLLERRLGTTQSLAITSILFGLSHFNKRAAHFNWRYVLLATLAGVFYGLAWRHARRLGSSAVTHASVDTIWSLWLR